MAYKMQILKSKARYDVCVDAQPQQQPQYSNGSFNGPAVPAVMMDSPPRPGMNRSQSDDVDDRQRLHQETVSANQQYERVRLCLALLSYILCCDNTKAVRTGTICRPSVPTCCAAVHLELRNPNPKSNL